MGIGHQNGSSVYYGGYIDDVRIYSRALQADQVYRLYQVGIPNEMNSAKVTDDPLRKGLVGYWKLDETSGTTAADSRGNSNNGTLTNGPTWTTGKIGQGVKP